MIDAFWFPSESNLMEREIVYQHIIQKPRDAVYSGNVVYHWVYAPVSIVCIDMKQNVDCNIAWNHVWLGSSFLRLSSQELIPNTPTELLHYCALKHYLLNLVSCISVENMTKIISYVGDVLVPLYEYNLVSSFYKH